MKHAKPVAASLRVRNIPVTVADMLVVLIVDNISVVVLDEVQLAGTTDAAGRCYIVITMRPSCLVVDVVSILGWHQMGAGVACSIVRAGQDLYTYIAVMSDPSPQTSGAVRDEEVRPSSTEKDREYWKRRSHCSPSSFVVGWTLME